MSSAKRRIARARAGGRALKQLKALEVELNVARSDLETEMRERERVESSEKSLLSHVDTLEKQCLGYREQVSELADALARARLDLAEVSGDRDALRAALSAVEREIEELRGQVETAAKLRKAIASAKDDANHARVERDLLDEIDRRCP